MKKEKDTRTCMRKTSIGGQALMEGIMMRGPKNSAMAVRNTKGEIVVEEFETKGAKRPAICRLPVIRGLFGYIDSMVVGYKCLMRSAELSGLEDIVEESPKKKKKREAAERAKAEQEGKTLEAATTDAAPVTKPEAEQTETASTEPAEAPKTEEEKKLPSWVMAVIMVVSVVVALAFMLFVLKFLPTQLFSWLTLAFPALENTGSVALDSFIKSFFEGIVKIMLLVGYMALITLMKDIRRTFMYHGAEHKTIFCYEAGLPLTVENIRKQRRFHPRCGTSFLILMFIVNVVISFFIDPITLWIWNIKLDVLPRSLVSLGLLPIIVGVGYELIKFAGRHDNLLTRIISAPGVWLQHITVFEPTDDMIECAIEAMQRAIPKDDSDNW